MPDFKKISKILRQVIATFFLVFALADLMVVDVLFPEHCGGDMFELQDVAQASSISPTNEDMLLPNVESLATISSNNQSSTLPETAGCCCFCCCTHLLLSKIIFVALPNTTSSTSELHPLSHLLSPYQSIFHPPRLI